jgi:uncharacterized protein YbjT (DUF2867 family)
MTTTLVTGGTGALGVPTVARLKANGNENGNDVRPLSRSSGGGNVVGDLVTGAGISAALDGADTVVHLASGQNHSDVAATERLLEESRRAGVSHFVLISIVGIDGVPLPYYRDKVTIEKLTVDAGLPYTILRATQFHNFVTRLFTAQRFSPVIVAPSFAVQPVAVEEVADRLVELATADPAGRVADIGGPEALTVPDMARAWKRATGSRRAVMPFRLPGRIFAAYRAGNGLVDGPANGKQSYEQYLSARYGATTAR